MIVQTILEQLEKDFPPAKAENWDNCGLQAGRRDKEIGKIYIALDPTEKVIEKAIAEGADLLLTHHPMTLSGLKKINTDHFSGRKFFTAIRADLCCYAMHTNYDVVEMASAACDRLKFLDTVPLEETGINEDGIPEGIGKTGFLPEDLTLEECAERVKEAFRLDHVKVFGNLNKKIRKVSICPGSGKSLMSEVVAAKSDLYITGDIGHHDGLDACEQGICVIDAGHFGLEHIFIDNMKAYLESHFPDLFIVTDQGKGPFQII